MLPSSRQRLGCYSGMGLYFRRNVCDYDFKPLKSLLIIPYLCIIFWRFYCEAKILIQSKELSIIPSLWLSTTLGIIPRLGTGKIPPKIGTSDLSQIYPSDYRIRSRLKNTTSIITGIWQATGLIPICRRNGKGRFDRNN